MTFRLIKTITDPILPLIGLSLSGYVMSGIAAQTGRLTTENIVLSQIFTLIAILINAYEGRNPRP